MDHHFLKFWGQLLLEAAEGQRRLEDLSRWIQSGFAAAGAPADLFRQSYGLPPGVSTGSDLWQNALKDFQKTLKTYAPLWGWVPRERYDVLKRKAEAQTLQIAEQERLIAQLEGLLKESGLGQAALATRFQNLIQDQQQAFDKLMRAMTASAVRSEDNRA
jgi:hypothetical protein